MTMNNNATSSGVLAGHVAQLRYEELPTEVIHAFKRALIDYLSCAIAGSQLPVTVALRSYLCELGGNGTSRIIGTGLKLNSPAAAFVNGAAAHGLDFDDGHTRASAHPGGVIFSTAIALGEHRAASRRNIISAAVCGYDVMIRVASAMHPASARQGWHNTSVAGVIGAAATASKILNLKPHAIRDAIGLSTSFSSGIRQYLSDGAEVKRLHPGKAARDGIICAELAERGISGPLDSLEGTDGLFRAMVRAEFDASSITKDLGRRFEITNAYFKPYPCCRHFHAALDAILSLKADHGFVEEDISSVDIGLYAVGAHGHDHKRANNLLEAQMSAPCAAAIALKYGRVNALDFEPARFENSQMQNLLSRISVTVDPECERIYPTTRSGVVRVTLNDGTALECRILDPRGEGAHPLSDDDLTRKFRDNCRPLIGDDRAEAILAAAWNFDTADDASNFFDLIG